MGNGSAIMLQFRWSRSIVRAVAVGPCALAMVLLAALGGGATPALAVTRPVPIPTVVSADATCAGLLPGSAELAFEPPGQTFLSGLSVASLLMLDDVVFVVG